MGGTRREILSPKGCAYFFIIFLKIVLIHYTSHQLGSSNFCPAIVSASADGNFSGNVDSANRTQIDYSLPKDVPSELEDLAVLFHRKVDEEALKSGAKFVDACLKNTNYTGDDVAYTENQAKTYSTSGSPLLDFFFNVMESTTTEDTINLLEKSWLCSPCDTVKLIANLRDIRGGKGIKYQTMHCFYWLYQNHPLTLYNNLEHIPRIGYWKDLLNILLTILFGHVGEHLRVDDCPSCRTTVQPRYGRYRGGQGKISKKTEQWKRGWIYNNKVLEFFGVESENSKVIGELRIKYAKHKYKTDSKYRMFHTKIAQLFADQLKKDKKYLDEKKPHSVSSLCAKWAPNEEQHFDKFSLISTSIAVKLLDESNKIMQDYKFLTRNVSGCENLAPYESAFAYLARKEFRKEFLVPMRNASKIPELYMHAGEWGQIDYKRVASKCMMKNKKSFIKYDGERFNAFLSNRTKVAGATLKPVELVEKIMNEHDAKVREVYEKQWISLVESLKEKGNLFESALSICDVSGSMHGTPLNAALGLTLITAQLSKPPWSSLCLTFSSRPQFHNISENTLHEKLHSMKRMEWEMNTNFDAAFELILNTAIKYKLSSEDLPKIVFVFTDMEFDQCVQSDKTNFEHIKTRFNEQNYTLPVIVFWKLRVSEGRLTTPVQQHESGCILISAYSAKLLTSIMNCKSLEEMKEMNPDVMLEEILKKYDEFKAFD